MENVRELWTKEKSMSISASEVDGGVDAEAVVMLAMLAMLAMESGGLAHRLKEYGAEWEGFERNRFGS